VGAETDADVKRFFKLQAHGRAELVHGFALQTDEERKFVTALFDLQDHYLGGNEVVMDMKLLDATQKQISRDGVDAKSTLQAPQGTYRLRQVVQEVVGGRMSAVSRTVEIR